MNAAKEAKRKAANLMRKRLRHSAAQKKYKEKRARMDARVK